MASIKCLPQLHWICTNRNQHKQQSTKFMCGFSHNALFVMKSLLAPRISILTTMCSQGNNCLRQHTSKQHDNGKRARILSYIMTLISFVVPKGSDVQFAILCFQRKSRKSVKMKLIFVLFIVDFVAVESQLNLPQVKSKVQDTQEGPEVIVLPNSYTDEKHDVEMKSDSNYRFDSDRSQRFGLQIER